MKLTENFSLKEFECKDGSDTPIWVQNNIRLLSVELQKLRNVLGRPIRITSAYRSPEYNKKIGGVANSQHLYGKAADIQVKNVDPVQVYEIIEDMAEKGELSIGGLGLYDSFVHIDIRDYKARWDYSSRN